MGMKLIDLIMMKVRRIFIKLLLITGMIFIFKLSDML